jgi:hypothetical protein
MFGALHPQIEQRISGRAAQMQTWSSPYYFPKTAAVAILGHDGVNLAAAL